MRKRIRACAICVHNERILLVRLEDPATLKQYLFPPGGAIEGSETAIQAAKREVREETGYQVTVYPSIEHVVYYPFTWNKKKYACKTHFFFARLTDPKALPQPIKKEAILLGVKWLNKAQAHEALAFNKHIQRAVFEIWENEG